MNYPTRAAQALCAALAFVSAIVYADYAEDRALIEDHRARAIKAETEKTGEAQKAALEAERQPLLFAFAFRGTTSFDGSGSLLSLGIQSLFDFET